MNSNQSITHQDLKDLMTSGAPPCVSIYMPTRTAGAETQQNPIRLKNLLTEAEDRLIDQGMRTPDARDLLDGVGSRFAADGGFWQRQQAGLAVFICPDFDRIYRLPLNFDELVVIGDRFHVKPLLPLLSGDGRFYVLAVSQNEIRLLLGSRDTVAQVELENVPSGLAEALKYDVVEKQLQHRLAGSPHGGGQPAVFHGHGGAKDTAKSDLLRYFQMVDDGLRSIFRDEDERAPLVLAGVDYIRSAYAQANTYSGLVEDGITGNPEATGETDLHQAAWDIVRPHFARVREEAAGRYKQLEQTDRASDAIEKIVPAAYIGRVETLFVAVDRQLWGSFDLERNTAESHADKEPGSEDLLDFAAVHTLLNGGEVFAGGSLPAGDAACAVFRYETGIHAG